MTHSVGIQTSPMINHYLSPNPDGNNSLPPRTNLFGFPSAFRDSISGSGGDDVEKERPGDEDKPVVPPKKSFTDWLTENSTSILLCGVVLFVFASDTH